MDKSKKGNSQKQMQAKEARLLLIEEEAYHEWRFEEIVRREVVG